jgi:PKD repeat protein
LTVNTVGSGSVTKNPNQATYTYGTVVTLTAVPATNWAFSAWSGAVTGSTNPVTITISANSVVTATFVNTCQPVTGANFSFSPTTPRVGQSVSFTATLTGGTAPITYTWNFGHGTPQVTPLATIVHSFPLTTTVHTYTVALTAANACTSSPTPVSKQVTVWPYTNYLPLIFRQ